MICCNWCRGLQSRLNCGRKWEVESIFGFCNALLSNANYIRITMNYTGVVLMVHIACFVASFSLIHLRSFFWRTSKFNTFNRVKFTIINVVTKSNTIITLQCFPLHCIIFGIPQPKTNHNVHSSHSLVDSTYNFIIFSVYSYWQITFWRSLHFTQYIWVF